MAASFNPPSHENKPTIPEWIPPEPTTMDLDWASLHTIDLSLLDSTSPEVVADLVKLTKTAIEEDGFLYLTNYGISQEQLDRQFALAQYTHTHISDDDKERLLWNPETGLFTGWKPRFGWRRESGEFDGIEQFNFYAGEFADSENKIPGCLQPYFDEVAAFAHYSTWSVNRRLLKLLSRVLELSDDYLWNHIQSHDGPVGDGYIRHALFHPLPDDVRQQRRGVRMNGHTDYGTTTFLFSVPVTALHIWSKKQKWQPVKYHRGALVVNLGDALEIISGGHFKATVHKVMNTPVDQRHLQRLSIVQFNASIGNIKLKPAMESPLLQREGFILKTGVFKEYKTRIDAGLPVPTNKEWREVHISDNNLQVPLEETSARIQEINNIKYLADNFNGVKSLIPL